MASLCMCIYVRPLSLYMCMHAYKHCEYQSVCVVCSCCSRDPHEDAEEAAVCHAPLLQLPQAAPRLERAHLCLPVSPSYSCMHHHTSDTHSSLLASCPPVNASCSHLHHHTSDTHSSLLASLCM